MSLVFAEDSFYPSIGRHRTIDEVDRSKYYEYKERLKERRVYALETRRQLNAGKVHRYWTAIRVYPNYYYGRNYYPSYNYSTVSFYSHSSPCNLISQLLLHLQPTLNNVFLLEVKLND